MIAATACLTLVTRNRRDFRDTGVPFIDPWEAQKSEIGVGYTFVQSMETDS
jgi:hypothetical protein